MGWRRKGWPSSLESRTREHEALPNPCPGHLGKQYRTWRPARCRSICRGQDANGSALGQTTPEHWRNNTNGGSLRLENISLPALTIDDTKPLTIDVVTTDIGGKSTQQLAIGLPAITGDVTVGAIKVGDTSAASIGSLTVSGLNMAGSTIKVWGH